MKTILQNEEIYLVSEFRPVGKAKAGEMALHKRKVESIVIFQDKFDYNGNYLSTEKVVINSIMLSNIRSKIEELESDEQIMETLNNLPF